MHEVLENEHAQARSRGPGVREMAQQRERPLHAVMSAASKDRMLNPCDWQGQHLVARIAGQLTGRSGLGVAASRAYRVRASVLGAT